MRRKGVKYRCEKAVGEGVFERAQRMSTADNSMRAGHAFESRRRMCNDKWPAE